MNFVQEAKIIKYFSFLEVTQELPKMIAAGYDPVSLNVVTHTGWDDYMVMYVKYKDDVPSQAIAGPSSLIRPIKI
jgi:hypothetical protein